MALAYAFTHVMFRMYGKFGPDGLVDTEEWSVGFRVGKDGMATSEASKVAFLETVSTHATAFHSNTQVAAGTRCFLTELQAAYIGSDGKYLGGNTQPTTVRPYGTPVPGIVQTLIPWDVACAYSLRSTIGRGRGSKGRFFYPSQEPIGISDGVWSSATTTGRATAAKALIEGINSAAASTWGTGTRVQVMSGFGDTAPVVEVRVGRAPDSQRRRTKSLPEGYAIASVAGSTALLAELENRVY
jgi:hypothetical protein